MVFVLSVIYSLFVCLAWTCCQHIESDKGITKNTEILKHHKAHKGFLLLHKSKSDETRIPNNAPTTITVGRCHTGALHN